MKYKNFTLLLVFLVLASACSNGGKYVNRDANYEIIVPSGWHVVPGGDGKSVSFTKYSTQKYGNSVISLRVDGIRFQSPMEQLENELLPIFLSVNENENIQMQSVGSPQIVNVNGKEWAAAKCYDEYDKILRIYVTFSGKYSFVVVLFAVGQDRKDDEKIFLSTIRSLAIRN
ncbi:MAG: hypothetical protein M0R20_06680 [Candidatus Omnitrophica bacterium]|jgi:hypothetical protein|nr:hypothetical protein [Candidatus Omnitrophota bacterium]